MVAGDALILPAPERVQVMAVERADDVGDVLAVVVPGGFDRARRRDGVEAELRRRLRRALVNENVGAFGVVYDHQLVMVYVVSLPQLRRDPQVVIAVARGELVAANLLPLLGL